MTRLMFIAAAASVVLSGHTAAQHAPGDGWMLEVEYMPGSGGVVSPAFPEATVRLLSWFQDAHAFAGGDGDVIAGDGRWSGLRLFDVHDPPSAPPPGTSTGAVVGSRVELFIFGQIFFPPVIMASTANPTPLWEGTWSTADFSPRAVGVETANTVRYAVYSQSTAMPRFMGHGSASIAVVPTPGAAAALALAGALAGRWRRCGAGAGEEGGRC